MLDYLDHHSIPAIDKIDDIGPGASRKLQPVTPESAAWPRGARIQTVDMHLVEEYIWIDRFPERLKDRVRRWRFSAKTGGWIFEMRGDAISTVDTAKRICDTAHCHLGYQDLSRRLHDLKVEGVEKELLFPRRLPGAGIPLTGIRHSHAQRIIDCRASRRPHCKSQTRPVCMVRVIPFSGLLLR
jgi:hypothetical protein